MDDNEDVDNQVDDADRVREAALRLHPVKELHRASRTSAVFKFFLTTDPYSHQA